MEGDPGEARQETRVWSFSIFCFGFFGRPTKIQKIRPMEGDPGKAKQETTKTADHMSTESHKSPNGVCNFVLLGFLFFRGFCMVCSRWPEPRTSKKTKLQTTCPQSQTRAPMGSAVLFFVFFWFSRFLHGVLQMARTSKIQKNKKTKLQTTCRQSQTRAPMGSAVLFFCFLFSRFLHGLLQMARTSKI